MNTRFASILYIGCILLSTVGAQQIPNQFLSGSFVEKTCGPGTNSASCTLSVTVQCLYKNDITGQILNCIDSSSISGSRAFLTIPKDQCAARGSVQAKIRYRACNDNNLEFRPSARHVIRFRQNGVLNAPNWKDPIPSNTCREYQIEESIDLCKELRVIDIEMVGVLAKGQPNYCRCYLFKESKINLTSSAPTKAPSASPTISSKPSHGPTKYPTRGPTARPTKNPTFSPTRFPAGIPTNIPTPLNCKYFFTELADPKDNAAAGFIEIRSTCPPNTPIPADLYVQTWKVPQQKLYLRPIVPTLPADRYIIICKNKFAFVNTYNKACDIENSPIHPDGEYSLALKDNTGILDIYGNVGQTLPNGLIFKDGRALRKLNAPLGLGFCVPNHWHIIPGNNLGFPNAFAKDMDPRDWKQDPLRLFFTEFADPQGADEKRFIELFSPNKRNIEIKNNLYIFKHDPTDVTNILAKLSLKGLRINGNGFLVLCTTNWSNMCTTVTGYNDSVVYSPGINSFTLQSCTANGSSCTLIDSYGLSCFADTYKYQNGRAVRKSSAQPLPSPTFNVNHWIISQNVGAGRTDPGQWAGAAPAPAPSPSGGPKKKNPTSGKGTRF